MASMQDILNTPSKDIEFAPLLPVGTYLCIIDGTPAFAKIGKNQTDCVNFKAKPVQPQADVDQDALQKALTKKDGTIRALGDVHFPVRQFITDDAAPRTKKFCEDCGAGDDSMSLGQRISMTPGCQVLISIKHRPSDDGTQLFYDAAGTAKVA